MVPDLWDSSRIKAESAPPTEPESVTPKILAVAGAGTHYGGGPSHNLYDEPDVPSADSTPSRGPTGFWGGLADDLNLPTSFKLPSGMPSYDGPKTTETSAGLGKDHSRTLDKDEIQGLWALLGLLTGTWLVSSFLQPSSAFAEKAEPAVGAGGEKVAGH